MQFNVQHFLGITVLCVLGFFSFEAFAEDSIYEPVPEMNYPSDKIKELTHQFVTLTKNGEPVKMSTRKAQYVTLD